MLRALRLIILAPLACGPASTGDTGDTGDTTTSSADTTTTTTGPAPTTTDVASSSSSSSNSTSSTDDTGPDATTGAPAYCQGWQGADGPPFLDLFDMHGNALADGSTLPLECGPQGIFMFGLYPKFGGFMPSTDNLDVDLVVDVDGFNMNPEGHFYSAHPVGYYIACDDLIGGVYGVLPVFPFDNLDDLTSLDGQPAHIQVTMPTDAAPIVLELDVKLSVTKDDSWSFCGG